MKFTLALLGLVVLVNGSLAVAYDNRCEERFNGPVNSVCQGRMLPEDKTRNIHRDSQQLVCSSSVDHYFRYQQNFDYEKWNDLLLQNQEQSAQNMRKTQPDIKWAGTIPYQTIEVWDWESCDLVTSGSDCGYHEETHTVTEQECSGEGNDYKCEDVEKEETEEVPNTCWTDVVHSESWPCSDETMTYQAQYNRPDYNTWKPGAANYIDAIPNKYDLLPGEVEDVQVFNSSRSAHVMSPEVQVGGAWNHYSYNYSGSAVGAECRQNDHLQLAAYVDTVNRNAARKSPNAFKMPRDLNGDPIDPIVWEAKQGKDGKLIEKGQPIKLILADTSSGIISSLAAQSEKIAAREKAKMAQGRGQTQDKMSTADQNKAGFFKNTEVRVMLKKSNKHLWDTSTTRELLLDQGQGVVASTNVLSSDQEIAYSDLWEIKLRADDTYGIYATSHWGRDRHLKPGQAYYFEVSMYQKGAKGLYLQDCNEDHSSWWACHFWHGFGFGRTEDSIFSDPIKIKFSTDSDLKDQRGVFDTLVDWFK